MSWNSLEGEREGGREGEREGEREREREGGRRRGEGRREGEREEEREEKGREETVPGFNSPNMVIDTIQVTSCTTTIQQYLPIHTYVYCT